MEKDSSDKLSAEKLEMNFRRFRDKSTEYTISKLVELLMGKKFVDGLGYDDDKLDVFYASFIINVIENFVSSENDKEILLALNGFLEGYDTMSVGERYKNYMKYAPSLNGKIKRPWSDLNKQFHYLEEPIEKTLANRLYGDITRDNRKKLKAIANQVIRELNEAPDGFPRKPKLRTIRELPQIQDNNTEENLSATYDNPSTPDNHLPTADENPPVPAENPSTPAENPPAPTENPPTPAENPPAPAENPPTPAENPPAPAEKDKENAKKIKAYILAAAAVIAILAGIAIFLATKAQHEVNLPDDLAWGWGDNGGLRSDYTTLQIERGALGNKIVFNSISDGAENGGYSGHEKNFVTARDSAAEIDGAWRADNIVVENNHIYTIRAYICNNNPNENNVAENTKICFGIPMGYAKVVQVNSIFESSNAEPSEYWDSINFVSEDDTAFCLEYVYGSALLWNDGIGKGGLSLGDEIVTEATKGGVLIGYDALDGRVPGGYEYHNYVSICVKAVFAPEYIR